MLDEQGEPVAFFLQTAEKTYATFELTVTNPGGHSSRPRPDNAIYALAHTLERLERHRFEPMQNETTRAYFAHRAGTADRVDLRDAEQVRGDEAGATRAYAPGTGGSTMGTEM